MPTHQYNLFTDPLEDSVIAAFPLFEGSEIEYKSAKGGFPASFWDTYSAFANTEGGLIVLGVREVNKQFVPDGLPLAQIQQLRQDFFNMQNNRQKISLDLLNDAAVKTIPVPDQPDQHFLAFDIPRANREQMPVHKGVDPFSGTYKRREEGDYRCSRDAVRRMIADSDSNIPADSRILRGFDIQSDIDLRSLQQYRQLMGSLSPGHPWLSEDDLGLLTKLGAYRRDRQSGQEGFTLAGMLMFGKTEAIHDNECAPQFFPDYREVLTQDPDARWTDRLYPDGTWEANLFQFYRLVWPRISAGLPRPFQLKDGQRQDETPAHVALREAFINSLIHADYSAPGSLVSIRRLHGFQFTNPGTLLISMRQYYEGGASICRNKALQQMFSRIGGAEQAGSGAGKIVKGWESAHWARPYLSLQDEPDRVTLELEMESVLAGQSWERLRQVFGERAEALQGSALAVLSIVAMEEKTNHRRLRYTLDIHPADLSALLKSLCQQGFLQSSGRGSGTNYTLNSTGTPQPQQTGLTPQTGEIQNQNVASPAENVASSIPNVASPAGNVASSADSISTDPTNSKLEQALLAAASAGWRTMAELAEATGRSGKYLRSRVIPELVSAGKLERRHTDATHPNQAYRTVR